MQIDKVLTLCFKLLEGLKDAEENNLFKCVKLLDLLCNAQKTIPDVCVESEALTSVRWFAESLFTIRYVFL